MLPEPKDKLEFKLFDPKETGEQWALELKKPSPVVGIYINGIELAEILKPIELSCREPDDECPVGEYGHLSAEFLSKELADASVPGTFAHNYGAYLLCCQDCGDCGCWSVLAHIEICDSCAEWTFSHNHRSWNYGLKYRFANDEYDAALNMLRGMF